MAASASSSSSSGNSYTPAAAVGTGSAPAHDIFLSHSGAQKGFVKDLYTMLYPLYSVFFDITPHSLPPADNFPAHIFKAANTCKLAVVVLSDEFLCSKWPMLELSTFVDAMRAPSSSTTLKILPLFYELSPTGLKDQEKLQGWQKKWEEFASKDGRISVSTWTHALKTLSSINGLVFNKSDGVLAYLKKIVSNIYQILPPLIKSTHPGIHGKDRLCQVIIDKFEELESRHDPTSTSLSKVCVLGVYGLSGSGKSTLSKCLRDHFFPLYAGKVLHLEVSTDPTPTELLNKSKELLKLTDFRDRMDLSNTLVDLAQVYSILKASNLQSSRVFLVIDNISSQDSIESVEAILQLGIGAGSKVMLVARTLKILHPLLTFRYEGHHYVCDSMRVPSINEEEAVRVLMQRGGGLGVAEHNNKAEEELSPKHKEIMVKVVRKCAFYDPSHLNNNQDLLYLPLVLKILGCQLRSYGMDLEMWERQLQQAMVQKDPVRKIVEESFEKLPEKLKLLFLDVALFITPYSHHWGQYEASVELLSFMHDSSPETIKLEMEALIRLCFLDLRSSTTIIVHDVFLGFAKCVSDASSMYYCKERNRRNWNLNISADVQIRELCLLHGKSKAGLRAIILELDEKCERFDFPAGFASVKVLVVRNCKLLAVLGLEGLTSLVSLEVEACPSLKRVELGADRNHLHSLKSVKWANNGLHHYENIYDAQESFMQMKPWTQEQSIMQVQPWIKELAQYMRWCRMLALSRWPQRPAGNGVIDLVSQVRGLQVLILERTGITCLGDASSCWPQLRALEVLEDRLEQIELGNLPNLKRFFFGDGDRSGFFDGRDYDVCDEKSYKIRMPRQTNLLVGCPKLEDVRICKPSCEDAGMATLKLSSNLHTLFLKHVRHAAPMLPEFTSLGQSLEVLVVHDHWDLRSVDFKCQFSALVHISLSECRSLAKITGLEGLPNLRDLEVYQCASLAKITGLEGLPNLRDLKVYECASLLSLSNLESLRMLEMLRLSGCPVLNVQLSILDNWVSLKVFWIHACPNVRFLLRDLANLTKLRVISCQLHSFPCFFNMRNLVNLEELYFHISDLDSEMLMNWEDFTELSLMCRDEPVNCETSSALQMKCLPSLLIGRPSHLSRLTLSGVKNLVSLDGSKFLVTLRHLTLEGLQNLARLDGIEFLLTLEHLWVQDLPNLTCLQGIECLIHLQFFRLWGCKSVEELPSLHTLVNMKQLCVSNCVNLKALEGCDAMRWLRSVHLYRCKKLECLPILDQLATLERLDASGLSFAGCKFASVKAMVAWVLDEEVPKAVFRASLEALVWEFTVPLLEKPRERMDLGVVLVETLGVYLSRRIKVQFLKDDDYFDFHKWVSALESSWKQYMKQYKESINFPGALVEMMRRLGRVPLKRLLQQCQSDAQFQLSLVHCLVETHPQFLRDWIELIMYRIWES